MNKLSNLVSNQSQLTTSEFYDFASNYFTYTNLVSTFVSNGNELRALPFTDLLLNSGGFRSELTSLSRELETSLIFSVDFLSYSSLLDWLTVSPASLQQLTDGLATTIFEITTPKLDSELDSILMEFSDGISLFDILSGEDDSTVYQTLSTPDFKLYYPEPFIASPSFVHEELWFIHILHYQHWLWFMFISLIMFYFISFINVVRWCNMRTRPRRETRGVSRSKCADLITATVPVSWAASIIISESVDATDYYDGFGSGEIIVGIRAYQWGWEYFYPKGIDLNYNVSPSYSTVVGNSLKYSNTTSTSLKSNTLWKHYKSRKISQTTSTPAHLLLSPSDNAKTLNLMNFADLGVNTSKDADSFKKIQYFSKTNPQSLFNNVSEFSSRYDKLANLYLGDTDLNSASTYGTFRQHNYASKLSTANNSNSLMDESAFAKYSDYNLQSEKSTTPSSLPGTISSSSTLAADASTVRLSALLPTQNFVGSGLGFKSFIESPQKTSIPDSETDQKTRKNPLKYALAPLPDKYEVSNGVDWLSSKNPTDFESPSSNNLLDSLTNSAVRYGFKDLKSSNLSVLSTDRNTRLIEGLTVGSTNRQFDAATNSLNALVNSQLNSENSLSINNLFNSSSTQWASMDSSSRLVGSNLSFAASHLPVASNNPAVGPLTFDRFEKGKDDLAPAMLRSKEESAPAYLFNAYWLTYWAHTNPSHRYENTFLVSDTFRDMYLPSFVDYAEYDFRNWQSLELLEDAFWESTFSTYAHDEYLNIIQDVREASYLNKQEIAYSADNRKKEYKNGLLCKSFLSQQSTVESAFALPLFTEDGSSDPSLTPLKSFEPFASEVSADSVDDTYENLKNFNYLHHTNAMSLLHSNLAFQPAVSYTQVLDTFTSAYDEKTTHSDNTNFVQTNDLSLTVVDFQSNSDFRASNPLKLRSSAKNSLITYNALQKVFKSRFDEGRSHARLQDFSNSSVSHPFITAKKTPYESLLGKNRESFYAVNNYVSSLSTNFSDLSSVWSATNVYFADLPFLVSMKSDPSRYLWFDWQSRWSSIELQPSSVARYSLLGVPYSTKSFEYSTAAGDEINDSETYLIKLARARKNYLPSW
jgi:hypothetical protein